MTGFSFLPHRDPDRLGLPPGSWPPEDCTAWQQAVQAGDLLADGGPAAHWSMASRRKVISGYGCYLGWLARQGRLDPNQPVTTRLTQELVSAYLRERRDQVAPATLHAAIADLRNFARVAYPDHDWAWMARLEAAVRQRRGAARDKRPRLRPSADLLALGEELMRRSSATGLTARKDLLAYRDGLMLAFLAARPLRLRSFAALTLGESLQWQGGSWWILLGPEATKNRRPLELPLPEVLAAPLAHYLAQVRPGLLGTAAAAADPTSGALWVSLRRTRMSPASIYAQITLHTGKAFGTPVNPHLFRDCAATSLALASPRAVRAGAGVLGHARYDTTQRHYNLACALDVAGRHHAVLQTLRGSAKRRPHG